VAEKVRRAVLLKREQAQDLGRSSQGHRVLKLLGGGAQCLKLRVPHQMRPSNLQAAARVCTCVLGGRGWGGGGKALAVHSTRVEHSPRAWGEHTVPTPHMQRATTIELPRHTDTRPAKPTNL
jgi:hypothetical protein